MTLRMMKRSEAARYARWSAAVAFAIAVLAAGIYLHRQIAERRVQRSSPPPVPGNVQQQSSQFSYSKVVGDKTLFTVRASRATEYKDQNRSMLQDVLITMYGRKGDRDDTISAHECSYLPATGQIQCQGEVQIQLSNKSSKAGAAGGGMHLATRDISFDPVSEMVSTPDDISLQIPGGRGSATGVDYDTKNEVVKFKSNVQLFLGMPSRRLATPVSLQGSSLEYRRSDGLMQLSGPVTAQEGDARLNAGALTFQLDPEMNPSRLLADHGVQITDVAAGRSASLKAERMETVLGKKGAIDRISADGDVHAQQKTSSGERRFFAQHVELVAANRDGRNEPRMLHAVGDIQADSQRDGVSQRLQTASLRVEFAPAQNKSGLRVLSANTQTPGEIAFMRPGENDHLHAGKLTAEFNPQGQLIKLTGAEGANTSQQIGAKAPQVTSARDLTAAFSGSAGWARIDESGGFKFQQGDRTASADRAIITRATNEIVLDGNASIKDASSNTSAAHIELNQTTGEVIAFGSVVSTYFAADGSRPVALGTGAAHISANHLVAHSASDSATYSEHARLWQGNVVLDAETIGIWKDQRKLQAQGDVHAAIPDVSRESGKTSTPVLWQVHAPNLAYWGSTGKIVLSGGVQAQSAIGAVSGETIEFLLAPDSRGQQRLRRAAAAGNVRIQSNGRTGTADRGEYTAKDGKFVLSGGQPTLSDALGNTTTGRELTFFIANDTILVDSQKGSRTVTKHRVEK